MNICFLLITIISNIVCSLAFDLKVAGLYESKTTLPKSLFEDGISGFEFQKIQFSPHFFGLDRVVTHYAEVDLKEETVYGVLNYDTIRSLFYSNDVSNDDTIQVQYDFYRRMTDSEKDSTPFNVRMFNLYKDTGNTLELSCDLPSFYLNTLGATIKGQYQRMICSLRKEDILEFKLPDNVDFPLFYFKNYEECLSTLKSILKNDEDFIGVTILESASKFLNYFGRILDEKELSTKRYIEAVYMLNDLSNMLGRISSSSSKSSHPFHVKAPSLRNESAKVYRSVCIFIKSSDLAENYTFEVIGYDSDDKKISGEKIYSKKIGDLILIPFDDLIKFSIQSIEVTIDGKSTGKITVSRLIIKEDAPVKTNN